ncbi:MAG: YrdB family protein, partial [Actinomycetota bacterium]
MSALRGAILTVRFLMELSLLAAVAFWGFHAGDGPTAWLLGLGAPVLVGVVWGVFVAPKAKWPVSVPVRLAVELVLFGLGAAGLAVSGHATLA